MKEIRYHLRPTDVGAEIYYFKGSNGTEVVDEQGKVYTVYPAEIGTFLTDEMGVGFERAYFILKFFSDDQATHVTPTGTGTLTVEGTADPLGLGDRRYKTILNGSFDLSTTDVASRTIPASNGPMFGARFVMSAVPTNATHFIAYMVKY